MSQETVDRANGWLSLSISNIGTALKRGWVMITLTSALLGASGYILYLNHKAEQTQQQLVEQIQTTETLKQKTQELLDINTSNRVTIEQIQKDKERISILVEDFNQQLANNNHALAAIGTKVATLKDGELAPVLRQTLLQIQQLRASRQREE